MQFPSQKDYLVLRKSFMMHETSSLEEIHDCIQKYLDEGINQPQNDDCQPTSFSAAQASSLVSPRAFKTSLANNQ